MGGTAMDCALAKAGWKFADLSAVVLHEANLTLNESIISKWRERGFGGRVLDSGGLFGNTTSASIPLALALNAAELKVGMRLGMVGFGGGLSASIAFGTVRHALPAWTSLGANA
jgi:3-oxoacyl-[acyl-carrier-protein] synthase III